MSFKSASINVVQEQKQRAGILNRLLKFGIPYLDDALRGIFPDDLILLGAPSGVGKTQMCVNIALANLAEGKRVHFIALEAGEYEIERRLKYQYIANYFFSDSSRPTTIKNFNFTSWILGEYGDTIAEYEKLATDFCEKAFGTLFTFYKFGSFNITDLILNIEKISTETDLILFDHVHYMDWDDDNDNKAVKEIAKTVRDLALEIQVPIVLVAHLRKRDKANKELVAGIDEFHGTSDLTKIATKVITIAPGPVTEDKKFITYFRIPKNRLDGGVTRYIGATTYNPKKGGYDNDYRIAWANAEKFEALENNQYPFWGRYTPDISGNFDGDKRQPQVFKNIKRAPPVKNVFNPGDRD